MTELSLEDFRDNFVYCPLSGKLLSKITRNGARKGAEVGSISRGYLRVKFMGKSYMAHRLAFLDMTGRWPSGEVDHIDGVRDNNRWANLRDVDKTLNQRNAKLREDNKTGVPGVYWSKRHGKWRCQIGNKYLGQFSTLEEAVVVRKQAESDEGYHTNHGRTSNGRYD